MSNDTEFGLAAYFCGADNRAVANLARMAIYGQELAERKSCR